MKDLASHLLITEQTVFSGVHTFQCNLPHYEHFAMDGHILLATPDVF